MENFFKTYNSYQNKLREYLIGKNDFLYGTIIGNKKGWRKNKSDLIEHYSFLLYYSHETGRIERFLYNRGYKEPLKDIYVYNRYGDNKVIRPNEDYIYMEYLENFLDKDFINQLVENCFKNMPIKFFNFRLKNNGKLDKDFYYTFILELIRDYLIFNNSFDICNMDAIRNVTNPILEAGNPVISKFSLGCGSIDIEKFNHYFKNFNLKDLEVFKTYLISYNAIKFIDYNNNHLKFNNRNQNFNLKLNVPANFNTSFFMNIFKTINFNLELVTLSPNDLPKSLKDLKSVINSRTVINEADLLWKIDKFNLNSTYKLHHLTNSLVNPYNIQDHGILCDN